MKRSEFLQVTFAFPLLTHDTEKPQSCHIKSSRICGSCEYRLAKRIAYEKGVKDVRINLKTKAIEVVYHPKKTTKEQLKKFIVSIGYDADELKADVHKREEVHGCCLKEGDPH